MRHVNGVHRMHSFLNEINSKLIKVPGKRVGNGYSRYHLPTLSGIAVFYGHPIKWERKPTYHIHWLMATRRGAGRAAMQYVCDLADQHCIWLHLFPVSIAGGTHVSSTEQLLRFYSSFGFYSSTHPNGHPNMWRKYESVSQ